jgi:rare lipoprotein A
MPAESRTGVRQAVHVLAAAAALLLLSNAAPCASEAYAADKASGKKAVQKGLASYYSRHFDGKQTASGDTFDNDELVAAHRTLPLGSKVRVTNLENGRSVVVRITDRGASAENRREGVIIDVSQAAAKRLQMKKDGRVRAKVEVLEWGDDSRKRESG